MPFYTYECEECHIEIEFFCSIDELTKHGEPECDRHGTMVQTFHPSAPHKPFPAFTVNHLKHLNDGKPLEITSLHQIRKLEKQHADRGLVWEVGSYNSERYGGD